MPLLARIWWNIWIETRRVGTLGPVASQHHQLVHMYNLERLAHRPGLGRRGSGLKKEQRRRGDDEDGERWCFRKRGSARYMFPTGVSDLVETFLQGLVRRVKRFGSDHVRKASHAAVSLLIDCCRSR